MVVVCGAVIKQIVCYFAYSIDTTSYKAMLDVVPAGASIECSPAEQCGYCTAVYIKMAVSFAFFGQPCVFVCYSIRYSGAVLR